MRKLTYYLYSFLLSILLAGCTFTNTIEKDSDIKNNENGQEMTSFKPPQEVEEVQEQEVEIPEDPIETLMNDMTLNEKIGQLFIVDIQNDKEGNSIIEVNEEVKEKIIKYNVGGIILFRGNIQTKEQTTRLIKEMQSFSDIPLFIGVDEEGGMVSRVGVNSDITEVPFQEAFSIGKTGDVAAAYKEARRMGEVLKGLGFNLNFAPVADIYNNETNTVIGTRSFGKTQEEVTPMVISYAKGLLSQEVQPVLKHFPGHGNTEEDSHEGLAYVNKTKEELEKEELIPFIQAAKSGIDVLMRGHLLVKDVDEEYPATLSIKWFQYMQTLFDTKKLLMITDALNMGAVAENYDNGEAAVMSFLAGNDILLMPKDIAAAAEAILKAYEKGMISEERLNESVRKILSKKVERNILVIE
ncbi:MAG: glycoside hydrolase family 3 domain protein [Clostridia bacterium]|jgi:beta-N-acetylhexosaminidase|nr:glycoside hydrolase family 3 domain protein [Clostridia bacterium]